MASALTTFAPMVGDVDALEAYVDGLSPDVFARLDMAHLARVQVFRSLVHQGPKQRHTDVLRAPQLVFTSTYDGPLDAFLDALASLVPEADEWWRYCPDYPGRVNRAAFAAWVRRHEVRTSLFASALPDATVAEVREALELRDRLVDFAAAAQGLDAAALQERFRAAF
jgi:hypothetical protein